MDESNGISPSEKLTDTIEKQLKVENDIQDIYDEVLAQGSDKFPTLHRKAHLKYTGLFLHRELPSAMYKLDASHPWIIYWLLNAHLLLGGTTEDKMGEEVARVILSYIYETDRYQGISGGYGQLPHLASTYAGIMSLALVGDEKWYAKLNRTKIYTFLVSLKLENGSFRMVQGGESDCRATYCALCVASILGILDEKLIKGTAEWFARCQTYEGGFGGEPGDEAHGGYTFCALAGLCILAPPSRIAQIIDIPTLVRWTCNRQYAIEGGLSGRTNKLVDGCYSHWVGGMSALLECVSGYGQVVNRTGLQNYILCCCQAQPFGLIDKPGCNPDFYHTNYVLCGLSMCQHFQVYNEKLGEKEGYAFGYQQIRINDDTIIDNLEANRVLPLDPIFGLPAGYSRTMRDYFRD
ncbi:hypothetical protein FOA43_002628 [Brettanomyces nanus]|uniref:Protein farnesyltransferase subunit beta n=1 Tax=Eeniella nana TaxID=13502 RepID=A0A875RV62_EENNA|nr:uncharacterized protein FOA43_002628 [Brettanomyces nanus]QPG75277.1 hypothetical protein FOA43_002628 [Brettanomyces nanus]